MVLEVIVVALLGCRCGTGEYEAGGRVTVHFKKLDYTTEFVICFQIGIKMDFIIRAATLEDCKDIRRMMSELSEHGKMENQLTITEKDLEQDGFSKNPVFHMIIAEVAEQHKTKDGYNKIGFSMFYYIYSWKGRAVFMEDLYVMPEFRGKGIGKALMSRVAQLGRTAGCKQLKFTMLKSNQAALNFYLHQGAVDLTSELGYHYMSCHGNDFQKLAD